MGEPTSTPLSSLSSVISQDAVAELYLLELSPLLASLSRWLRLPFSQWDVGIVCGDLFICGRGREEREKERERARGAESEKGEVEKGGREDAFEMAPYTILLPSTHGFCSIIFKIHVKPFFVKLKMYWFLTNTMHVIWYESPTVGYCGFNRIHPACSGWSCHCCPRSPCSILMRELRLWDKSR